MANLIFTNSCNIQCPFCFATENNTSSTHKEKNDFNMTDLWKTISFLDGDNVRFCGGEPTQNRNIIDAFKILLNNKKQINIMSNGIWPLDFTNYIQNLSPDESLKISYLFNILPPQFYNAEQLNTINRTLSVVNPNTSTLGFTIYKINFEFLYLLDLAEKFNIRNIRWSVCAPNITGEDNKLENDFPLLANELYIFFKEADRRKLSISKDCGYIPLCYYNNEQLVELNYQINHSMRYGCMSAPIDIDNKGNSWRCYGLYSVLKQNISNFKSEKELRKYFDRRTRFLDKLYLYEECKECKMYHKSCGGGCYAMRVKKALSQNPNLTIFPIDNEHELLRCIPRKPDNLYIKNNNIFWNNKVLVEPDENTLAFINEIDGTKSVLELISIWENNFSTKEIAKSTILNKCKELFEKDMILLEYDYKIKYNKKVAVCS